MPSPTSPATAAPRVALVTNIPAPYRVPVYNRIAAEGAIALTVFYAARSEPDRQWDLPAFEHEHRFLEGAMVARSGRFIHHSPDLWQHLVALDPDVVITTGYNPTHLLAFAYTQLFGKAHVPMTDGTVASEATLSALHRLARHLVIGRSRAAIVASNGGWRLLRRYGMAEARLHFSPLCANTAVDWGASGAARDIDLLFSGRLVAIKNAGFALEVAAATARRLGRRLRLALLGSGPLEAELRAQAATLADHLDVQFAGHVSQREVPAWFQRARLFLFPTRWDPWGVVANEACEAGVPVLTTPHAGAAGEIVRDGVSGRVLPLVQHWWVEAATAVLSQPALEQRLSAGARTAVAHHRFDEAAAGIVDAALQATASPTPRRSGFVRRPRVVCVQRRLTHYRLPLFEQLRDRLDARGIEFVLVHGAPAPSERSKHDGGELPWALRVPSRYACGERIVWQPPGDSIVGADLVIVPHENRLLHNLVLLSLQRPARLAFWGHGRNFQAGRQNTLREGFKRRTLRGADWWFAYTSLSAAIVRDAGFAAERITTLDNAVDTQTLARQCAAVDAAALATFRAALGLGDGPVGVFVGSLYADKRIEFLLQAATELRRRLPGFQLLVVGDGPLAAPVQAAAAAAPWIHALGARLGADKALCLRVADVMLNPGLVGLGILDAFVAGLPLLTTDCGLHSPEIAYLRHGENGLMSADRLDDYVAACEQVLVDAPLRARLAAGARADAERYTVERMAGHFAAGIEAALALPPRRP